MVHIDLGIQPQDARVRDVVKDLGDVNLNELNQATTGDDLLAMMDDASDDD